MLTRSKIWEAALLCGGLESLELRDLVQRFLERPLRDRFAAAVGLEEQYIRPRRNIALGQQRPGSPMRPKAQAREADLFHRTLTMAAV